MTRSSLTGAKWVFAIQFSHFFINSISTRIILLIPTVMTSPSGFNAIFQWTLCTSNFRHTNKLIIHSNHFSTFNTNIQSLISIVYEFSVTFTTLPLRWFFINIETTKAFLMWTPCITRKISTASMITPRLSRSKALAALPSLYKFRHFNNCNRLRLKSWLYCFK